MLLITSVSDVKLTRSCIGYTDIGKQTTIINPTKVKKDNVFSCRYNKYSLIRFHVLKEFARQIFILKTDYPIHSEVTNQRITTSLFNGM